MEDYSAALSRIFEGRARYKWSDKAVPMELIGKLYDYVKFGPTSVNSSPARFTFVFSQEAKDRLAAHAFDNNKEKTKTAPCVVIVSYDEAWYEALPKLLPIKEGARDIFAANAPLAQSTAFRNGSLQGAYLIVAARLLGLDCGPMSGFNNAAVDADFFAGTTLKSNFLCAIGYANDELFPRLPRLSFDEACTVL
jgi:3-hydroxypropanoate dehydrogenase